MTKCLEYSMQNIGFSYQAGVLGHSGLIASALNDPAADAQEIFAVWGDQALLDLRHAHQGHIIDHIVGLHDHRCDLGVEGEQPQVQQR